MKKPATFEEAFQILDRAIVDIDEPKLRPLVDGEIFTLKTQARNEFHDRVDAQKQMIALGLDHAEDVVQKVSQQVGQSVRQDPLLYIGVAALAAGAIGVLIASRREARV